MRYAQRAALVYKTIKQYSYKTGRMVQDENGTEVVCCHISHVNAQMQQRYGDVLGVNSRVIRIKGKLPKEVDSVLIDGKKYKVVPIKNYSDVHTILFVSEIVNDGR